MRYHFICCVASIAFPMSNFPTFLTKLLGHCRLLLSQSAPRASSHFGWGWTFLPKLTFWTFVFAARLSKTQPYFKIENGGTRRKVSKVANLSRCCSQAFPCEI
jgi:hypothetical protein